MRTVKGYTWSVAESAFDAILRETTCYNTHMLLIASLPRNDAALAKAAVESGADMLKVHLNVKHTASGNEFGTWQEELERIQSILDSVSVPVGVMPGSGRVATQADWGEMVFAGIEFFDIYVHDMPAWMWELPVQKMPAIHEVYSPSILLGLVKGLRNIDEYHRKKISDNGDGVPSLPVKPAADYLEASIVIADDYGKELNALDLANYRWLSDCVDIPVIVPTQKRILTGDIPYLLDVGIGGIMVGKIVTGDTPESVSATVDEFRKAIDNLV